MTTYSFYDKSDGRLIGVTYSGPEKYLESATPAGCHFMLGCHDHAAFRVVQVDDGFGNCTPAVVPRLPDRPHDTDLVKWEWSEDLQDWAAVLTDAGRLRELRSERDRLLSVTDVAVRGGLERLLVDVATQLGVPVDASLEALLSYRQQLRDAPARPDFSALQPADLAPPSSQE